MFDHRPSAPISSDPVTLLAGGEPGGHGRAILVVADDFAAHAQFDQLVVPAGVEQHPVQVAAMNHGIGIAETGAEGIAQVDVGDFLSRKRIHQPELVDIDRHAARGLADAEIVEGMERVGPELDARADLAERRGLLQQDGADSLLRKTERGGEAADASTRDQDRPCARRAISWIS